MDPDANLKELIEYASSIISQLDCGDDISQYKAERLAELVIALDEWIRKGGFLPQAWRQK